MTCAWRPSPDAAARHPKFLSSDTLLPVTLFPLFPGPGNCGAHIFAVGRARAIARKTAENPKKTTLFEKLADQRVDQPISAKLVVLCRFVRACTCSANFLSV